MKKFHIEKHCGYKIGHSQETDPRKSFFFLKVALAKFSFQYLCLFCCCCFLWGETPLRNLIKNSFKYSILQIFQRKILVVFKIHVLEQPLASGSKMVEFPIYTATYCIKLPE